MLNSESVFESIVDQKQPIQLLTTLYRKHTVPHALLFTGIDGIGKKKCSIAFAMLCNCINEGSFSENNVSFFNKITPCGQCISCNKILSENHPDIIFIEPSGASIKIDQIRELCRTLTMKPFEARRRIVIISNAQAMSTEAGNALLKNLEEPPENTVFILTALQVSDLLPTIVSRCQHIRFNPVAPERISEMLINHYDIDKKDALLVAHMANGSLGKAVEMIIAGKKFDWIKYKRWLLHVIFKNIQEDTSIALQMAFASKLSEHKEFLMDSLDMIMSFFRDFVVYQYYPENVIDSDVRYYIQYVSEKVSVESAVKKIEAIQTVQKDIRSSNINVRLILEALFMKLAGI
jgi:DNA polymerase-3 subunit delta'